MSGPWVGMDEVMAQLTGMVTKAQAAARESVAGAAAIVEKKAKGNFQGHHRKGEPHIGGPRSYPNVVSGTLRRSITHTRVREIAFGQFVTTVGPTAKYGRRVELEYGYAFFAPAREESLPAIQSWALSRWQTVRG